MSYKVSENDIAVHGMTSIETRPTSIGIGPTGHKDASKLKDKMDDLPAFIAGKHNSLVEALGIEEEEPGEGTLVGKVENAVRLAGATAASAAAASAAAAKSERDAEQASESSAASASSAEKAAGSSAASALSSEKSASAAKSAETAAKDAQEEARVSKDMAVASAQSAEILKNSVEGPLAVLQKKVENLEDYISPSPFIEVQAEDGVVHVPDNALPWAAVTSIGGMSERVANPLSTFQPNPIEYGFEYKIAPEQLTSSWLSVPIKVTGSDVIDFTVLFWAGEEQVWSELPSLEPDEVYHEKTFYVPKNKVNSIDRVTIECDYPTNFEIGALSVNEYELVPSPVTMIRSYGSAGAVLHSLAIPEEVQSLSEYGCGITSTESGRVVTNRIIWNPDEGIKEYRKQVVKLTLTGDEHIYADGTYPHVFRISHIVTVLTPQQGLGLSANYVWRVYPASVGYIEEGEFAVGYGLGGFSVNTGYSSAAEWKTYLKERYNAGNPVVFFLEAASEETTDISSILPDDNLIEVSPGGTIVAETSTGKPAPFSITFMTKEAKV